VQNFLFSLKRHPETNCQICLLWHIPQALIIFYPLPW
jgi:hypothetical protein